MPFHNEALSRRLLETPEPYRSGIRPLASSLKEQLLTSNAASIPPAVVLMEAVEENWPELVITDNLKSVTGMVVAEVLGPDLVPGRRKSAPRGSILSSGTLFVPRTAPLPRPSQLDEVSIETEHSLVHDNYILGREILERASDVYSKLKNGSIDDAQIRHLRHVVTLLQIACGEPDNRLDEAPSA